MPRCRKPPNVTDHRHKRCGGHDVDAWDRHEATHVLIAQNLLRDDRVDLRELLTEEVQLTQSGIDGEALVDGQLLRRDPCSPWRKRFSASGSVVAERRCSTGSR